MTLDTKEIEQREKIAKEIARTSESIRKKHRTLKTGRDEHEVQLKKQLKPIVEPLQQIIENTAGNDKQIRKKHRTNMDEQKLQVTPDLKEKKIVEDISDDDSIGEEEFMQKLDLKKKRKRWSSLQHSTEPMEKREKFGTPLESKDMFIASTPLEPQKLTYDEFFDAPDVQESSYTMLDQIGQRGKELYSQMGPLGREYIGELVTAGARSNIDNVYGVHFNDAGTFLGDKAFDIDGNDDIIVDGVKYAGTRGLYELIFKRVPHSVYTDEDMQTYKNILLTTNAYRRGHSERGPILGNRGYKYKHIIAPLIGGAKKGGGVVPSNNITPLIACPKNNERIPHAMTVTDNAVDYVHWDDPNELVDRLRLLDASHQAGNNSLDNEFLSIIEELREAGLIIN